MEYRIEKTRDWQTGELILGASSAALLTAFSSYTRGQIARENPQGGVYARGVIQQTIRQLVMCS